MSKREILDWMDKRIEIARADIVTQKLNDEIMACANATRVQVQIHVGIDKLSNATEIPLNHEFNEGRKYKHEYYFAYRGIEFFQLEEEPNYGIY